MRDVEAGEPAELQGYSLEPVGPWHVRISPYPFGEAPARFSLVRRVLSKAGRGRRSREAARALAITVEA